VRPVAACDETVMRGDSSDSEESLADTVSQCPPRKEEMLLASSEEPEAGAEPLATTSAVGITAGVTSSATGQKRKTEMGQTLPQACGKRAQRGLSLG